MANLFKNVPHLLRTITNLDRAHSMSALASIKTELKKRQRSFDSFGCHYHRIPFANYLLDINPLNELNSLAKSRHTPPHEMYVLLKYVSFIEQ
ncbi:DNA segregation ATPase FtsK/SpoIIIE-like protein [Virgibacillus natechei]|uniref:DNA segregation ATPase FtsK/SpoIIIE-like protein n=1 Tax=Virgibacillus natechei TaxID=1216297 RepID=A0ABS4ILF7_9BACI|nr:DNA segregation ATPase FtsK/SpoIIIE-like protein [Virgibacillus natechei]